MVALVACQRRQPPVRPERRDIVQAVYASGKAYPTGYYRVVASVPGYLDKMLVRVGDTVRLGQPLFTVKNEVGAFNLEASQNTLAQAERNAGPASPLLRAARQDVEAARARLALDSLSLARLANLQEAGAGTRQSLDQARTQYETSLAAYRRAQSNLEATRQRVATERANAQAAYQALRAGQNTYTVYSALAGMVYDQLPRVGEYVGPTTVVVELGETATYEVELAIDEADLNLVRPGQRVYYAAEALGKALAQGTITKVYPKISASSKSVKAISTLELPPGKTVFAGSTLEANIVCQQKKQALVLPRAFVLQDSVTVRQDGDYVRRPVTTGVQDADYVEILSGLGADQDVYK